MLEKGNWFKRKPDIDEGNANKRMKLCQKDGNPVGSVETGEGWQLVGSRLDTTPTVQSFPKDGNMESRRMERPSNTAPASSQLEEPGQDSLDSTRRLERVKEKFKKGGAPTPPTIGVMFVDQTPGGQLARNLQAVEDRLARASGYRIRMVELSGTPLQRLLPNTDPWAGQPCGRDGCYTCKQDGERKQNCKKRNILYESSCTLCNPEDDAKKESVKDLNKKSGVYVGESARSIFERAGEHHADLINKNEDSHMLKHWLSSHPEAKDPPTFRIKVLGVI